ncbi:AAA family ATPase [Mitsuaria sp. WAJ17]|uniref:AAA family ATPase n=1 Tax=Mitsuaria sp. WAJ17 TaxID=2761452 RepID=UPI001C7EC020|nr:AAA family ATPase [Mitsuaria sp. WAJ17]
MSTSSTHFTALSALWDEFLARWPMESLRSMSLEEYSQAGSKDCFTYWLETRTEDLGSIWGGSAFKFGVYSRKDQSDKSGQASSGLSFGPTHGWLSKYGTTAEQAFEYVRGLIADIAQAAREGRLDAIEAADLGHATKWKIAFLYQDRANPVIAPVFKRAMLDALPGVSAKTSTGQVYQQLMAAKPAEQGVLEYGTALWQQAGEVLAGAISTDEVLSYLQAHPGITSIKPPTKRHAGFRLPDGRELCLMRARQTPVVYFQPGHWTQELTEATQGATPKGADDTRSHGLAANAPTLAAPNPAVSFSIPSRERLLELLEAYTGEVPPVFNDGSSDGAGIQPLEGPSGAADLAAPRPPLNQILYGPPGTGKTYSTIDAALEILDPAFKAAHPHPTQRAERKARFDELTQQGQVEFVTFHQSFSYEDFVEGLRAKLNDDKQLEYSVEPGVFKRLCDAARPVIDTGTLTVQPHARVWKISIAGTGPSPTKAYCLDHNEARVGWGKTGDLLQDPESNTYYQSLGSGDKGTLRYFAEEMEVGDILLCIHSAYAIAAVGVVTGDYRHEPPEQLPKGLIGDYQHVRPVQWLYKDLELPIEPINEGKTFTLKTVYQLNRLNWADLQRYLDSKGCKPVAGSARQAVVTKPYVLVVDEINRGNISRIFGELITLIEPSKRAGSDESLQVTLPYSKKPFSVPDNVYLIGTMNTADRSLTGMDVALRRRFEFVEMPPRPEELKGINVAGIEVQRLLEVMNERIEALLDRDHRLGHAFFMPLRENRRLSRLEQIFRKQVLPLLQEYFFDDWQRIQWVLNDHRKPEEFRFVRSQGVNTAALFGDEVNVSRRPQAWYVNDAAFREVQSYLGVIDHLSATEQD